MIFLRATPSVYKIDQHGAQDYENLIYKVLSDTNLDIKKCKGQGYDGASVMKGMYSGVQKRITDKAPNATYVHCCAHNLNLVICYAAKSSSDALQFFETIYNLYLFFSAQAHLVGHFWLLEMKPMIFVKKH